MYKGSKGTVVIMAGSFLYPEPRQSMEYLTGFMLFRAQTCNISV
jgi:hypothetical protein